jgi:cytochrome c oxidase subunit 3
MLLASLGMGFGALLVFYLIMGMRAAQWPPAGTPELPDALWISTFVLLASSGTMHWALRSVKRGRQRSVCIALSGTALLAVAFLASQTANWFVLAALNMPASLNMFAACFYLLTGLHGLHVLGGLVPLGITLVKAFRRRYTADSHAGLRYCAVFWHFLDVTWIVMFAALTVVQ